MGKKKSVSDEELKAVIDAELDQHGSFTSKVLQELYFPHLSLVTIYGLLKPFVDSGYLKKEAIKQNSKHDARIEYRRTKRIKKEDVVIVVSHSMEKKINEIHALLQALGVKIAIPKASFWSKVIKWFDRMGW